ncbi:MAG: lysophospholipid acyltransferase family protein [Chitinispirillaceae bacterium]|nr:lysophospholipid acyltransferase family protein [Chitinispirillaceae bacterium]
MKCDDRNCNAQSLHEWTTRAGGNRGGTRFFEWIITAFGLNPAYGVLIFVACQYALLDKKVVDAIRDFRAHVGFSTTPADLFHHIYSFGITLIDRYAFISGRGAKFQTVHCNEATIIREVGRGKGVILLGAHVGNWEYAGNLLTKRITAKVHVFMYDAGTGRGAETASQFQRPVVHHVQESASDTAVEIINALRRGEIVCLHGDRFFGDQRTESLDFFGKPAPFPAGPMAIAAITGASVIPCFTVRTALRQYTFSAAEPVYIQSGNRNERDERIRAAMRQYVDALETMCRQYPRQWYNFYRFWQGECEKRGGAGPHK